jgi:hypothetical protein
MRKPLAIVVGFIGKLPYGGMILYNLHYIAGLQALGYDIHYLERQNKPWECYDPAADTMTDDPHSAIRCLETVLSRIGISRDEFSFIDQGNRCHGSGWKTLRQALGRADFLLTLCDPTWFDELELCGRRAFVDGDPAFTQIALAKGEGLKASVLAHYPTLFTYGTRIGADDCPLPDGGRTWIPTRPVVATSFWKATTATDRLPITALLHWAAGKDVTFGDRDYGHKNREFERFIELPNRTNHPLVVAVDGAAPRKRLLEHGWTVVGSLASTLTIDAYRAFINGSRADFGIAKHAYVASRCGWFSDRSTCFLASGRPVLHQDTGCGDWLPTGEGVLLFSTLEDATESLAMLDQDYPRHAQAARKIAEEHFEAVSVLGLMLDQAGFR